MIDHLQAPSSREGPRELQPVGGGLAQLVDHLDAAYNLARWLMRDEAEADDLVQEAYVRAISAFAGFRGGDGRAWLLTIVRNTCYTRLTRRSASGRNTNFDEAVHSSAAPQPPSPEAVLLLAERTDLVSKELAELPEEYREVLVLRELEQMSYREIGSVVGIPLGTVMSRLSRARQQLARNLSNSNSPISARLPVDC